MLTALTQRQLTLLSSLRMDCFTTTVEVLCNDISWNIGVVTKSRNVTGRANDSDVGIEQWLDSVQEDYGRLHGKFFRDNDVDDLEDLKELRPSLKQIEGWIGGRGGGFALEEDIQRIHAAAAALSPVDMLPDGHEDQEKPQYKADILHADSNEDGIDVGYLSGELRAPLQAVKAIYGDAPLMWMQVTLLLAEQTMRFDQFEPDDFQEVKWKEWGRERLLFWLDNPANAAFRVHFKGTTQGEQAALFEAVLEPFELFDQINTWTFETGSISCYTYLSMLGQGALFPLITLFIQTVVPMLLLRDATREYFDYTNCDGKYNNRFLPEVFAPDPCEVTEVWYCPHRGDTSMKLMILCVMLIYATKVVPDNWYAFTSTVAEGTTDQFRMNSLRKVVWDHDEDTFWHKVGYRVDLHMGSAYKCVIYMVNLVIIFFTHEMIDIILNALAIEFVCQLDEMYVGGLWWDKDFRYLKAGAIEMATRRYLRLQQLTDLGLNDIAASRKEESNSIRKNLTPKEKKSASRAKQSNAMRRTNAIRPTDLEGDAMSPNKVMLPPLNDSAADEFDEIHDKKTRKHSKRHGSKWSSLSVNSFKGNDEDIVNLSWKFIRKPKRRFLDVSFPLRNISLLFTTANCTDVVLCACARLHPLKNSG